MRAIPNPQSKSIVLFLTVIFSVLTCHAQVTTETIISNADDITKRNLSLVSVVKYEPLDVASNTLSVDSANMMMQSQSKAQQTIPPEYGFVKSTFVTAFPEALDTDERGEPVINYNKLIPIMFRIIQDQNSRIITLENKVKELQKK